ncbi:uncharacterized protein LOC120007338 [Tripterygium wilfordii]|uniref:uncharacterized protein LOC120007338 n=1 Tax=Tripterygium wilfordii TaxID=458696 RepID=UPI0018F7F7EE|nr:uncharacterized protein LOC120007338 [Tripterygium wilfordii]
MASNSNPEGSSQTPSASDSSKNVRGKSDPAWRYCKHVQETNSVGRPKNTIICMYCLKEIKGGGINRFKIHLSGVSGQGVERCKKVPAEVQNEMLQNVTSYENKKRLSQDRYEDQYGDGPAVEDDEVEEVMCKRTKSTNTVKKEKKKSVDNPINSYFMSRTTPGSQPTIKSVLQSQEAKEKVDLAIAKWMIDASIPFNATNSKLYQPMIDAIASIGPGYKGPSIHAVRGKLLGKSVEEVKMFVKNFHSIWKVTGCTIMSDGWTDQNSRTLINFLVYCPKGTIFLKSVDASEASKTGQLLFKLFREVVLDVGVENVVQVVTDNASNYVMAGRLLEGEFPTLSWSPCAAHCLNLMFQDIGKLEDVSSAVKHAAGITKYIYNHCFVLNLMRQHTGGREIIRPAPTRFATNFVALQSILAQKDALRAMVTCKEWIQSSYSKDVNGRRFANNVLDSKFWSECGIIVQLTEPLMCVLRLVDGDDRPAMGYLYKSIHVAKDEMIRRFQRKKRRVQPLLSIVDSRWDSQLYKNLHAAGFWLNPSNQYNIEEMTKHRDTGSGILDVIEKFSYGDMDLSGKLTSEMRIFVDAEGDFGRKTAINDREKMLPAEWWRYYGNSAPNLQKLAMRVLSQTCSSSGCERNWSIFEHIHSKKRNRLEHQRLNDLVYVHYNLRLQQRNYWKGRNYDPINFEDFTSYGSWILEEEPPLLTIDEVQAFRELDASSSIQDNNVEINLDEAFIEDEEEDDDDDDVSPQQNRLNVEMNIPFFTENIGGETQVNEQNN